MAEPARLIYQLLKTSGGSSLMSGDGSSTPVEFYYECPVGFKAHLNRFLIHIQDATMTHITYGGIAALTNGVELAVVDSSDNILVDLLDGHSIQDNGGWESMCYDAKFITRGASDLFTVRWTFIKDSRHGVVLEPGDKLQLTVNDNLVAIDHHEAVLRGELERS